MRHPVAERALPHLSYARAVDREEGYQYSAAHFSHRGERTVGPTVSFKRPVAAAAAMLLGLTTIPIAALPAVASVETCEGLAATIVGTSGPDFLVGTSHDDVIVGGAGDDVLRGGGGDDVICGGSGDDEIAGGDGADTIRGAPATTL